MRGSIVSSGFASGDRVVVGHWQVTPIGPLTDVMWATPDGHRILFAPHAAAAEFITSVYAFDDVEVCEIGVQEGRRRLDITMGDRELSFIARRGVPIPFRRPAWFTRLVEGPIARVLMGVVTYGTSPTGVREWYRADRWAPLRDARATVSGASLGPMVPVDPPCGFGFSEPPARPSWVAVRPLLEYPD
ncbi:hypothetical protein [Actinospongicola halichondriae]|uniref:hypothetical protein n=1 Tax=Actinospongicola halichondriae TaxID=3236844 RepID=UPI003D4011B6